MRIAIDHVAVLTADVERLRAAAPTWLRAGDVETFPSEGTVECYLRPTAAGAPSVLVVEPIADGPYRSALDRRGPGLHHVAWTTDDLDRAVDRFVDIGLRVHEVTATARAHGTAWMYRDGLPLLVELIETSERVAAAQPAVRIDLPATIAGFEQPPLPGLTTAIGERPDLVIRVGSESWAMRP